MIKNNSVKINGIRPELVLAIFVVDKIYSKYGKELIITSCSDGKHSKTSLHYSGCAVDLRISYFTEKEKLKVVTELKEKLKIDFDIILEHNHIHLEYQPRYKVD